jgi:hypothetical protein
MKLKWVNKNWRNIKLCHLHPMQSFLEQNNNTRPMRLCKCDSQKNWYITHYKSVCHVFAIEDPWLNGPILYNLRCSGGGFCHTTSNWCMNTSHQCLWKPWNTWYFQCWDQIVTPPFPFAMMSFGPFVGYYKGTINKSIWNGWWTTIWISLHILHML